MELLDGYSWLVLYLHCANNNHAATVLSCFTNAVGSYGFPKKIRTDRGGENQSVARLMLETTGDHGHISLVFLALVISL